MLVITNLNKIVVVVVGMVFMGEPRLRFTREWPRARVA
jgi:hypothetical protein